jgi:hypothetical protein
VFRESGVVHSFKMVDPVLFVFGSNVFPFHYSLISQSVIGRYVAWVADTSRNKPQISN